MDGVPFLQTTNISKASLSAQNLQRTSSAIAAAYPRTRLKAGDVILGIRASIGAAHVVPRELCGNESLEGALHALSPSAEISSEYLMLFLRSRATGSYWEHAQTGHHFQ